MTTTPTPPTTVADFVAGLIYGGDYSGEAQYEAIREVQREVAIQVAEAICDRIDQFEGHVAGRTMQTLELSLGTPAGPDLATADDVIAGRARYADTPGGHADRRILAEEAL